MTDIPLRDQIARTFHESYERLAPAFGYRTREESAVVWEDVPTVNKDVMLATADALLEQFEIRPRPGKEPRT